MLLTLQGLVYGLCCICNNDSPEIMSWRMLIPQSNRLLFLCFSFVAWLWPPRISAISIEIHSLSIVRSKKIISRFNSLPWNHFRGNFAGGKRFFGLTFSHKLGQIHSSVLNYRNSPLFKRLFRKRKPRSCKKRKKYRMKQYNAIC